MCECCDVVVELSALKRCKCAVCGVRCAVCGAGMQARLGRTHS